MDIANIWSLPTYAPPHPMKKMAPRVRIELTYQRLTVVFIALMIPRKDWLSIFTCTPQPRAHHPLQNFELGSGKNQRSNPSITYRKNLVLETSAYPCPTSYNSRPTLISERDIGGLCNLNCSSLSKHHYHSSHKLAGHSANN